MIICIVGPTAVGKTKLSISLAKIYNGEIINADSVQVYKRLNIGSAKITEEEKEQIPHHLLDIVDPKDNYTIYNYQKDARKAIETIKNKKKLPIIVGGSGLYIKAALYDYKFPEEKEKEKLFPDLSNEQLAKKILDYDKTINIEKNNRRRLVRTYNKILKDTLITNNEAKLIYDDVIFIGLKADRDILYNKIDKRIDNMLVDMVTEVKELWDENIHSKALETAIGYKELYDFFDNKISFKESINKIKQNSRNYAKRQYTFFNHQLPVKWFEVDYNNFSKTIKEIIDYIETKNHI